MEAIFWPWWDGKRKADLWKVHKKLMPQSGAMKSILKEVATILYTCGHYKANTAAIQLYSQKLEHFPFTVTFSSRNRHSTRRLKCSAILKRMQRNFFLRLRRKFSKEHISGCFYLSDSPRWDISRQNFPCFCIMLFKFISAYLITRNLSSIFKSLAGHIIAKIVIYFFGKNSKDFSSLSQEDSVVLSRQRCQRRISQYPTEMCSQRRPHEMKQGVRHIHGCAKHSKSNAVWSRFA